jgi:TPR repeat protein
MNLKVLRKVAIIAIATFCVNTVLAKELYQEAIDWFTGRDGHAVSFEEAKQRAKLLMDRNEVVGFCIMGSIAQLEGNDREAQELYFKAFSSGDLIRYAELEPDAGNFFLGEYYMVANPVDIEKANRFYKKSADLGFGAAMAAYGVNRLIGNGISPDIQDAKSYLIEGMSIDNPHSYYNFAIYLLSIEKNRKVTARGYLEYAKYRGFTFAVVALDDWF